MHILVVDDNAFILEMIRSILDGKPYTVESCTNVEDALAATDRQTFDLVVTDIVMPVKSGVDFIREMKKRGLKVPVLAITGGMENAVQDCVHYADLYADETLMKPFKHSEFLAAIDRLGGRAARH